MSQRVQRPPSATVCERQAYKGTVRGLPEVRCHQLERYLQRHSRASGRTKKTVVLAEAEQNVKQFHASLQPQMPSVQGPVRAGAAGFDRQAELFDHARHGRHEEQGAVWWWSGGVLRREQTGRLAVAPTALVTTLMRRDVLPVSVGFERPTCR